MNELGIRFLRPTARGGIDLVRKGAHGRRDGDALDVEKALLRRRAVVPIRTGRRSCGVRQPVERDVLDNVVSGESFGLPVEHSGDQLVTADVVVEDPGSKADW